MESTDDTLAVAESYGAKIVRVPAAGFVEPGRQAGIDAADQPWVLILDADERAGPGLMRVAADFVHRPEVSGVWLPRQNVQFGWWVPHSGIWPDWQLRLFRRDLTHWSGHRTHVRPDVAGRCEFAPEVVDNAIVHFSNPTIANWISGMNRYTELEADRLQAAGTRPTMRRLFLQPTFRFAELYLKQRGYRGGRYGLAVALMSFCYWLLTELKLWERNLTADRLPRGAVSHPDLVATVSPSSSQPGAH